MKRQKIYLLSTLVMLFGASLVWMNSSVEELHHPELNPEEHDEEINPEKNREWTVQERDAQMALLATKRDDSRPLRSRGSSDIFGIGDGSIAGAWIDRGPENIPGAWELATIDVGTDTIYATTCGHYGGPQTLWKGTLEGENFSMLKGSGRLALRYRDINVLRKDGIKTITMTVQSGPLYYSHDDGMSWQNPTGLPAVLENSVIDRKNGVIYSTDGLDIYISTDMGASFSKHASFGTKDIARLHSPHFDVQPGYGNLYAVHGNDFYEITIDGTITKKGTLPGPDTQSGHFAMSGDTRRFYVTAQNSNATVNTEKDTWWTSTDGGSNWVQKYPTSHYYSSVTEMPSMRGFTASPLNPDVIIAGYAHPTASSDGLTTSYDDETYWGYYQGGSNITNQRAELLNYYHPDFQSTHIFLDKNGKEFSLWCSDGGLLYNDKDYKGQAIESANVPNKSWRNLMLGGGSGVTETYAYGMVVGMQGETDFALGTQDQGVQKSQSPLIGEQVPVFITVGGDGEACGSGPDGQYGWAISGSGVKNPFPLYNGTTFNGSEGRKNTTKHEITQKGIWFDLANYSNTIWVLNGSVNKLVWNGSWTANSVSLGNSGYVGALCQSPDNTSLFWAIAGSKVYKSTNGGASFGTGVTVPMSASTAGSEVRGWAFDDNTILFAGKSGNTVTSIISTDGGATFTEVSGLPNTPVRWMQGDKDDRVAMASTKVGAYLFDRSQNRWYDASGPLETGAPYLNGQWGAYIPSTNTFRFSTWGYGIWDFVLSEGAVDPYVTITTPNGGEVVAAGESLEISWNSYFSTEDSLVISLMKDGGATIQLATVHSSVKSYNWSVASDAELGDYSIVIAAKSQGIADTSDATFAISAAELTVTYPNGDEYVQSNSLVQITWNSNISGTVSISLLKDGSEIAQLGTVSASSGSFDWNVGSDIEPGTGYSIAITSSDNGSLSDNSDGTFSVVELIRLSNSHLSLGSIDSEESGREATNSIDDDTTTFWHSEWSSSQPDFPHTFVLNSDTTVKLAAFAYLPRQDGSANGRVKEYAVEVSSNGADWVEVQSGELPNIATKSMVMFKTALGANYVRFVMKSEQNDQFYASMAEFELYYLDEGQEVSTVISPAKVRPLSLLGVQNNSLQLHIPQAGLYQVRVTSLNGRVLMNKSVSLSTGITSVPMVSGMGQQIAIAQISGKGVQIQQKIAVK